MNSNKILIQLYIPLIEEEYDIFIPINKRVGTIKQLLEKSLSTESSGYVISQDTNLYSKDTGIVYDVQMLVKDTDLRNGSRVVLLQEVSMDSLEIYKQSINQIFSCLDNLDSGLNDVDNTNSINNLKNYKELVISFSKFIEDNNSNLSSDNEVQDDR